MNKILLFLILSMAAGFTAPAQTTGYTLDGTSNGVDYYHRIVDCGGHNTVLLRFNNTTSTAVKVTWSEKFVTQEFPTSTLSPYAAKELIVQPGDLYPTGCADSAQPMLVIDRSKVHPTYLASILGFEFSGITVTTN